MRILAIPLALLSFLLLLVLFLARPASAWTERVDPALLRVATAGDPAEFLVVLNEQADLSNAARASGKLAKGTAVYETLRDTAARSQAPLLAYLKARGAEYRPYWVKNMVWVRGDRALLQALAVRPEVSHIYANQWQRVAPEPLVDEAPPSPRMLGDVLPGLDTVNAPEAWAAGYLGQGVVIGGQDTGYDWTHPALKPHYRGWNGATADHDYNWHDAIHNNLPQTAPGNPCGFNSPVPCDDQEHGTHTMGTMVGDDGKGHRYGVAPQAKWIGCRNMEEGWGSPQTYAECYEWFIAPYPVGGDKFTDGDPSQAPDVINNSWSCPESEGCTTPEILQDVVTAVRAAGIVTVHSAGNEGPSCGSISTPAAIYDASFTVAATDDNDSIVGFSSRGPAVNGLAKPDISAPGLNVLSTIPGGGEAYLSGTSMAAPHVAGVVALLLSANPDLKGDVDAIETRLKQTARPLKTDEGCGGDKPTEVPNHTYGWGGVDAAKAVAEHCYALTLGHVGQGQDPVASQSQSANCEPGYYWQDQVITLTAQPASGWAVVGWAGTLDDASSDLSNLVVMPGNNHEAVVQYARVEPARGVVFIPHLIRMDSDRPTCFAGPDEIEPNTPPLQGQANGPLCSGRTYYGWPNDKNDFFYIIAQAGPIDIDVKNHRGGNTVLILYYASLSGTAIAIDNDASDGLRIIKSNEPAGVYYIRLFSYEPKPNEQQKYSLKATFR